MDVIQVKFYVGQYQFDFIGEVWRESYVLGGIRILDQGVGISQLYIKDFFEENVNFQVFYVFNLIKQFVQFMGSFLFWGEGCKEGRKVYRFFFVFYELNISI